MRRFMQAVGIIALAAVLAGLTPREALGQANAQADFAAGQQAYTAGHYAQARDLFAQAAATDTKNAEVFLWLGKSQYQLGEVDKAMEAWRQTVALAPNEPYATAMLAALQGQTADAQATLALIDIYLKNGFFDKAVETADRLLKGKALTDAQRVAATTLRAKGLLGSNHVDDAQAALEEMLLRYPKEADNDQTTLVLARARLHRPGETAQQGLAALKKLAADHAQTPAGIEAQYELIVFDLDQGVSAERVAALTQWMTAHGEKTDIAGARRRLIDAELALTNNSVLPSELASLSAVDAAAIGQAAELYARLAHRAEATELTQALLTHLNQQYVSHGALAAGITATDLLLKASLEPASRLLVMQSAAGWRAAKAMHDLGEQARAGRLAAGPLPQAITDVLAIDRAIDQAYPTLSGGHAQVELAEQLRVLGKELPWPAQVTALKGPYAWALEIDLPIIKANANGEAVKQAVQTIQEIVNDAATVQPAGSHVALDAQAKLLDALAAESASWLAAMGRQAALLDALAVYEFNENLRSGHADLNAKLSATQEQLLGMLIQLVNRDAGQANSALESLQACMRPWLAAGDFDVGEQALAKLSAVLPEAQRRSAQLAIVNLWVRKAMEEHQRLTAAGLIVPRGLDDSLNKALVRLYELQAGLLPADPFLAQVRKVAERIVNHYEALRYDDVALAAAKVKSAPANGAADLYGQYQLARLGDLAARRDLAEVVKHYKAAEKLAPTDSTKAAMAAWEQFITDHIGDPLVDSATDACLRLARQYEENGATGAARELYMDLAAFAAKQPALAHAAPGSSSFAERAEYEAAGALDIGAHTAFARALAAQPGKPPAPPTKISDEYLASDAAYRAFLKVYPDSPLASNAVQRLMYVAIEYARADAWDVADGIFADLMEGKDAPPLRDPQRVAFCRAMCQIGKVMPEHANQVLATLASGEALHERGIKDDSELAKHEDWRTVGNASVESDTKASEMHNRLPEIVGGNESQATATGGSRGAGGALAPFGRDIMPDTDDGGFAAAPKRPEDALDKLRAAADNQVLAAISQQEARRATQVSELRDMSHGEVLQKASANQPGQGVLLNQQSMAQSAEPQRPMPALSAEELARQQGALDAAYAMLQGIRVKYARTVTADQCRGEMMLAINYWRSIGQWDRAATLGGKFLKDNPADIQLPNLRLGIAQDLLAWAAQPIAVQSTSQAMLAEVSARFDKARQALTQVAGDFPDEKALDQQALWEAATSFVTQARAVGAFSATLSRGQYARAAQELDKLAVAYADHPRIGDIPRMLWDIAAELQSRGYAEEAIAVWNDLAVRYPTHALAAQAVELVAQTYQGALGRPLRAAEAYVEINFARGGDDANIQTAVFTIGAQLKQQKRWVESLHVLQLFVASFPRHASAGQALTMIGQIHQANQAWQEAIAAYTRVINEYPQGGNSVQEAKWSIAECIINLSKWPEAISAYESYVAAFGQDSKVGEANRRIGVLKDLANYQMLVDEKGPKAFDAQFQMAVMIQTQLANDAKAIEEYQKVATNYPDCHLAGSALHAVGVIWLQTGEIEKARDVLRAMATRYPDNPMADDALFRVGKSFEDEAQKLGELSRGTSLDFNGVVAQKEAYKQVEMNYKAQRTLQSKKLDVAKSKGKSELEIQEAANASDNTQFDRANIENAADQAQQVQIQLTAEQLADRQDKINAALRKAVAAYADASRVPGGDKAGDALLRMAVIYSERLGEPALAMTTWLEIVRQYSGTAVAEEASWQIAQNYEHSGKYAEAVDAYKKFLANYRRSPRAEQAQFFIAENYEHLGQWVSAMDQYTVYLNNYPNGALAGKAHEQINFIKTYRLF